MRPFVWSLAFAASLVPWAARGQDETESPPPTVITIAALPPSSISICLAAVTIESVGEASHRDRAIRLEDREDDELDEAQRAAVPAGERPQPIGRGPARELLDEVMRERGTLVCSGIGPGRGDARGHEHSMHHVNYPCETRRAPPEPRGPGGARTARHPPVVTAPAQSYSEELVVPDP